MTTPSRDLFADLLQTFGDEIGDAIVTGCPSEINLTEADFHVILSTALDNLQDLSLECDCAAADFSEALDHAPDCALRAAIPDVVRQTVAELFEPNTADTWTQAELDEWRAMGLLS